MHMSTVLRCYLGDYKFAGQYKILWRQGACIPLMWNGLASTEKCSVPAKRGSREDIPRAPRPQNRLAKQLQNAAIGSTRVIIMNPTARWELGAPLRWRELYREAELYKAAVRVYTKPLFQWRKALSTSTDGRTIYDLAGRGLRGLDAIHRALVNENFAFRPPSP